MERKTLDNAIEVKKLSAWFGDHQVLREITMGIRRNSVTSVMGPSGCGKSTFIRCLNRMHELTPGFRTAGEVLFDGRNVLSEKVEPCSALDPVSTGKIEELIEDLSDRYTIVVVTHNMQQAARISDSVAFFLLGELIEMDKSAKIFTNPADKRTEEYITGRFG